MQKALCNNLRSWTVLILAVSGILFHASAAEVRLAWNPPSVTTGIAGYTVHYGTTSRQYSASTNVGNATSVLLPGLSGGVRYFFAVTSNRTNGYSSDYSAELSHTPPEPLPLLGAIDPVFVDQNTSSAPIPIPLDARSSSLTGWSISAASGDPSVIANGGLALGGTGTNRWLVITPVTNALGASTLSVWVTDGIRTNATSFVATVTFPNVAPTVDAGTNATIRTNVTYMLRGRVTDDGLPAVPGRVSAAWSKVSGPGTITFGNSNFVVTTARFSAPGIYRLRLTATDGQRNSSGEVVVRVQVTTDFVPPVISDFIITDVTDSTVTLEWTTDELADEQVEYTPEWLASRFTLLNPVPRVSHVVNVTNLSPSTTVSFVARSRDTSLNRTNSEPIQVATLSSASVALAVAAAPVGSGLPLGYAYDGEDQPVAGADTAEFRFDAPASGSYHIWVRVQAPANIYQAYQVTLNGMNADWFDAPEGSWRPQARWVLLNGRDEQSPLTLNPRLLKLAPAGHVLRFTGSGATTSITRILLSSDPAFVPDPTQDQPMFIIPVRTGWSMIACPLQGTRSDLLSLMPSPAPGTVFYKWSPQLSDYISNLFDGSAWEDPAMTLVPGEGGLIYNPDAPFSWVIRGDLSTTGASLGALLTSGLNFVTLPKPRAGLLSAVLPGFTFKQGDILFRINPDGDTYLTSRFDGTRWDLLPTLNLGEAFFLHLVER